MSNKSKGCNTERELIHLFWSNGWASARVAGSGSIKYPAPDIIAGKGNTKIVIECKATKANSKYLTKEEISALVEFAELFGAIPLIGVRFNNKDWSFLKIEDLVVLKGSFVVNNSIISSKGMGFHEILNFDFITPK